MMGQSDDMRAATEKAAAVCEQIAVNLRKNAIACESTSLRRELEGCAETADQCATSIRFGRPITQFDKALDAMPKRQV